MFKTEGFRLIVALAIVAGGAIALFFTFHSLAAQPDAHTEQSAIVLPTPQSGADAGMSGTDASQSANGTSGVLNGTSPTANLQAPADTSGAGASTTDSTPAYTPPSAPQQGSGTVPVAPAPPIDLDDNDDDPNDDPDDDPNDSDPDDGD